MFEAVAHYFSDLAERFGNAWNRFWFTPRDALVLSLMRVLVGLIALYAIGTFSFDLVRFFGAHGLTPAETVQTWVGNRYGFSYLAPLQGSTELWIAHVAGLIVLLLFTIGLWTRVTSVLAAIVVLSYIHRAPMLTAEFEWILALLMVYLCLAPTGDYLSIDAWRRNRRLADLPAYERHRLLPRPRATTTIATRLIQVHLTLVYLSMGLSKLDGALGDVWWGGTAIWWMAARPEQRIVDLTGPLHRHIYVINLWTHLTVLFELSFPVFVWNRLARPLMLAVATVMWLLTILATGLATFGLTMIVGNLVFVSPEWLRSVLLDPSQREPAANRIGEKQQASASASPAEPAAH